MVTFLTYSKVWYSILLLENQYYDLLQIHTQLHIDKKQRSYCDLCGLLWLIST